ncbi:MAG: zinc transporter ZupT [Lentisphaerae bacterium]|nr:zinc transporter ZupT [Lentisphaerota bacterium]
MDKNLMFAFGLTIFAGLSTGIGSLLALVAKRTNKKFLSASLGFSAGVMIYVSFMEIMQKALNVLIESKGEIAGTWYMTIAFFGGIAVIALIDRLIPSAGNPHEPHRIEEMHGEQSSSNLMRMGMFTALAIAIHNFPEGLATFSAALTNPTIGISIAIAIAIHNIPEGISVSVPIYAATGSRKRAFWLSFLSGVSEPVGALIGYTILRPFFSPTIFGILFASVAGIMVFVSLDELLPTARKYDTGHFSIYGVIVGMVVMALSLVLLM